MLNKSKIIFFSSILALTSISPNFNFIKANSFDSETKVIKSFFVFSNIEGYTSKKVTEDCGIKHIVKDTLLKDLGTVEEHTRIDSLEVNLDTISDSSCGSPPAYRPSCSTDPTRASNPTPHGRRYRRANWASFRQWLSSPDRRRNPS